MKILMTIHAELSADAGASGVTLRLAEAYRAHGHETLILSLSDLPDRLPTTAKMLAFPTLVARRAASIVSRQRVDVLDASTGDAWIYAARAHGPHRPLLVARSHGLEHTLDQQTRKAAANGGAPLSWKYPLYNGGARLWEVARSLRSSDVSLYLNEDDRSYAVDELRVPRSRTEVVRNGISQAFLGLPEPVPSHAPLRIAVVGWYLERKGVHVAAKALNALLPRHPDWTVSFLGTGCPEEQVLADYDPAVRAQLSVVPRYDNDELPDLLHGHDVHLFPTLREGSPLALLESMACGLAPVVSRIPGPVEVLRDGTDGILVPPSDAGAIEVALEALAADPDRLQAVRAAAHATAQGYGWDAIAGEQLAVYEQRLTARATHS